jgi:hypothetical protein
MRIDLVDNVHLNNSNIWALGGGRRDVAKPTRSFVSLTVANEKTPFIGKAAVLASAALQFLTKKTALRQIAGASHEYCSGCRSIRRL